MHALGIPTTRALCVVGSDAPVYREDAGNRRRGGAGGAQLHPLRPLRALFSAQANGRAASTLADFVIDRFYPACRETGAFDGNPYAALLDRGQRTHRRHAGAVAGRGLLPRRDEHRQHEHPGPDHRLRAVPVPGRLRPRPHLQPLRPQGRYAYNRQPNIAYWNLFCLGQALLPLIGEPDQAMARWNPTSPFPARTGCAHAGQAGPDGRPAGADRDLIDASVDADGTGPGGLQHLLAPPEPRMAGEGGEPVRDLFIDRAGLDAWMLRYQERIKTIPRWDGAHQMLKTNPRYMLRNHLGEEAIRAAKVRLSWVQPLLTLLERPFDEHPGNEALAGFPPDWASTLSISCSS
jgi:uncharacterized protein YdiU (UPF0061 family)